MKSLLPLSTRFSPLAVLAATASLASAGQIHVPTDYATLQEAIDAAVPNDEILVGGGEHTPVVIDKPLSITGVAGTTPLLRSYEFGDGAGSAVLEPPITLTGAGVGTVVLTGLEFAGTVDYLAAGSVSPVSAIEGGGFDELHIVECTVTPPGNVYVNDPGWGSDAVSVSVARLVVANSTITGGSATPYLWGSPFPDKSGHAITTTGDVTICSSTVLGGSGISFSVENDCGLWGGGAGGDAVSTPGTVTHSNSTIAGGTGAVVTSHSGPVCHKPDGVAFAAAGSVIEDPSACSLTLTPSPCSGATGPIKVSTFKIWGTPNGTDWWWYFDNGGTPTPAVQVPGVSSDYNGDNSVDELDVADAFVDAINAYATANSWPDLSASRLSLFGSSYLSVSSRCQPSLLVSSDGISFCNTSLLGACPFNPQIQLVPLPGWDCNENGTDDELDLASGLSQDTNSNGILDECEASAWTDEGFALAGVNGEPLLVGTGTLAPGTGYTIELSNAAPSAIAVLFLATSSTPVPLLGGTLKAYPYIGQPVLDMTSPTGQIPLTATLGSGMPSGVELWVQWAIQDPAAIQGWALSNAIRGVTQ